MLGKVIEVFIPEEYKDGKLLDVMDRKNIGFNIETEEGIKEIILKSDEINAQIMKDDIVEIIEEEIDGEKSIIVEPVEGEEDE